MLKKIDGFFKKHAYLTFLLTLIFWIGFFPLLEITGFVEDLELIIAIIITLSSNYFFNSEKAKFQSYLVVPSTLIVLILSLFFPNNIILSALTKIFLLILFFFITIHFYLKIFKHKIVDRELIIIAIANYVLSGLMFSILCWFTYNFYPGSYNITLNNHGPILDFTYYSIVTMSTLGYGDILPLLPQSRSLAIIITIVGQFYMAILMAFLIGKFINQKTLK